MSVFNLFMDWHFNLSREMTADQTLDSGCRVEDVLLEVLLLGILYIDVCVLHPVD